MNKRKLRAKCVELGLSAEDVSKAIGMNISTYYRKMQKGTFTVAEVREISKFLELQHNELMNIFFEN